MAFLPPLLAAILVCLPPAVSFAADPVGEKFFQEKVRPILADSCFSCHSHEAGKSKGGLLVDSHAALLTGGDTGPAIVLGKPETSLLIKAIRHEDPDLQMPPKKSDKAKLTDTQIATLTDWVKMGAPWPAEANSQKMKARAPGKITEEDRKWWAIQPLAQPQPPQVAEPAWAKNPIDAFIAQKLAAAGLAPAPPAAPEQLCRRLYFDLTGLPPSPREVAAFADRAGKDLDAAVASLVDELLASPRYGEHWARHWLDLVRYAESDGYKSDDYREEAWRYRDYVVQAFNTDKPYARFVQEQLAGDELFPDAPEARVATGYFDAGIYEYNNRDAKGQWTDMLNEITDVTGDVFLGLGLQCARCHDHKFDPLLQQDYFRLRAFFAPLQWGHKVDTATAEERQAREEKMRAWEEKSAGVRLPLVEIEERAKTKAAESAITKFPADTQAILRKPAGARSTYEEQIYDLAFRQVKFEWANLLSHIKGADKDSFIKLQKQLAAFDADKPKPFPLVLAANDIAPLAPPTLIPKREKLGDILPGVPTILREAPLEITALPASTGRRSALAKWLTEPENPLSTRVIVNRVWQYHFGRGLVAQSSDFGLLGEPPTHPELLDWLTRRFVADGWSIKKLHRLILTSAAYRQSTASPLAERARLADPDNKLLWHAVPRRLDAEQIRDAILTVSGELKLDAGGPSVNFEKPRRTIYTRVMRNSRDGLLEVLDAPEGFSSTPQRNRTTTASQALTMFNGQWLLGRARALSKRVIDESSDDDGERIAAALRLIWQREPAPAEIDRARKFLTQQTALIAARPPELKPLTLTTDKMPFRDGKGVVLSPGGVDRLAMRSTPDFPENDFTLEAFIVLKSLYENGEIRTVAAHWEGAKAQPGWAFGITGKQSRFKPQTLVLQLNGEGSPPNEAEPIFSGLNIEVGKPYYIAVTVHAADLTPSGITFYAKDLSNDDLPMQVANVAHTTRAVPRSPGDFTLGARGQAKGGVWDGLIDDVRLSRTALPATALLYNSGQTIADQTVGFWRFETANGLYKDSSPKHHDIVAQLANTKPADPRAAAFADLCHILLNSNEFLYLD